MGRTDLVLDVETIGPPWRALDESTREHLGVRAYRDEWSRLDADRQDAIIRDGDERVDRTALALGLCEVIAVGMWLVKEDRGYALVRRPDGYDGPAEATCELGPYDVSPEHELLLKLWYRLSSRNGKPIRLITFNGRSFDLPVLAIRSAQLGVQPSISPAPYRYDVSEHCDLAEVLTGFGATRMYSLEWWCERLGIESPKTKVDGAKVGELWRDGKLDDVATYVLGDVRAEARLFRRLAPVIRLLKGGHDVELEAEAPAGV